MLSLYPWKTSPHDSRREAQYWLDQRFVGVRGGIDPNDVSDLEKRDAKTPSVWDDRLDVRRRRNRPLARCKEYVSKPAKVARTFPYLPIERWTTRPLLCRRMNIHICAALTMLGVLSFGTPVWAVGQPRYIECETPLNADQEKPVGSVWTFALLTEPKPKLLERIEIALGDVKALGRLMRLSDTEMSHVNNRGAKTVTVWETETAASITGKMDSKFYTFDTCTTLWACMNSFRFSRQDLSLWVAQGSSLGSAADWHKTSYQCHFIEEDAFAAALDGARAQVKLNAEIEQEVLAMREQESVF